MFWPIFDVLALYRRVLLASFIYCSLKTRTSRPILFLWANISTRDKQKQNNRKPVLPSSLVFKDPLIYSWFILKNEFVLPWKPNLSEGRKKTPSNRSDHSLIFLEPSLLVTVFQKNFLSRLSLFIKSDHTRIRVKNTHLLWEMTGSRFALIRKQIHYLIEIWKINWFWLFNLPLIKFHFRQFIPYNKQ